MDIDALLINAVTAYLREQLAGQILVQVMGRKDQSVIGNTGDASLPSDDSWINVYPLNIDPVRGRGSFVRSGIMQINCFAHFASPDRPDVKTNQPWITAGKVTNLLAQQSLCLEDNAEELSACVRFQDPRKQYIDESQFAAGQGKFETNNVHQVVCDFEFQMNGTRKGV
jgi:hypothetical protein